jgi:hypothetical protein
VEAPGAPADAVAACAEQGDRQCTGQVQPCSTSAQPPVSFNEKNWPVCTSGESALSYSGYLMAA